ncbi:MAG: rod shape-determining protein [Alphaproteobacteria bacterium]|nr:rod shape-determining protein [Alphaproteobacteria bacterium]
MVSGVISGMLGALSQDVAIDLGTSETRVAVKGRGVVLAEPSMVAVRGAARGGQRGGRQVIAVGGDARRMLGRTPVDIEVIRPIRDGVISDFEVTEAMLREFVLLSTGGLLVGPRAVMCVPLGTTDVERRALRECAEAAGVREVVMLEQPIAAALGAGLDVTAPQGCMVVDIGGGTTQVAVLALAGTVRSRSVRVGGDQMDEAIVRQLRAERELLIGPVTAEHLKLTLGSATPPQGGAYLDVRGRDLASGYPRAHRVSAAEVHRALAGPVALIVEAVLATLDRTPPELSADITDTGVVLTGGGAQLPGLDRVLRDACGVPVVVASEPADATVLGAARAMAHEELLRAIGS